MHFPKRALEIGAPQLKTLRCQQNWACAHLASEPAVHRFVYSLMQDAWRNGGCRFVTPGLSTTPSYFLVLPNYHNWAECSPGSLANPEVINRSKNPFKMCQLISGTCTADLPRHCTLCFAHCIYSAPARPETMPCLKLKTLRLKTRKFCKRLSTSEA